MRAELEQCDLCGRRPGAGQQVRLLQAVGPKGLQRESKAWPRPGRRQPVHAQLALLGAAAHEQRAGTAAAGGCAAWRWRPGAAPRAVAGVSEAAGSGR